MPETQAQPQTFEAACDMWQDENAHASVLLVLAIDTFGPECLDWHPQTLRMQIHTHFGAEPADHNFDRLMAAVTVVTTDLFFKNLPRFIQLAGVLAGSHFDPETFQPVDAAECAWAITEALLLSPPDDEEADTYFCGDIRHYISHVLKDEGFIKPPDILRIAIGADFSNQVHNDYRDDPVQHQGIWQAHTARADEITDLVRNGLHDLLEQLRRLSLQTGSLKELEKRLAAA